MSMFFQFSPPLKSLILSEHCADEMELLEGLGNTKSYHFINLNDNCLSDEDLKPLYQLEYLHTLYMSALQISGECIANILKIPGLSNLDFSENDLLDDEVVGAALISNFQFGTAKLKCLSFSNLNFYVLQEIIQSAFEYQTHPLEINIGRVDYLSQEQLASLLLDIAVRSHQNPNVTVFSRTFELAQENHAISLPSRNQAGK